MARRPAHALLALVLVLAGASLHVGTSSAAGAPGEISASVSLDVLSYGSPTAVTGHISEGGNALGGAGVELQADPFPYKGFLTIARATSAADGSFAFAALRLERDTRLRVIAEAEPETSSAHLMVLVNPGVALDAQTKGPGETRLSLRLQHAREGGSASLQASWYLATGPHSVFHLAAVTPTREISSGLTYASATIDPPSRRFAYIVCLTPPWRDAMSDLTAARCPGSASLAYGAPGNGIPLAPYPSSAAIADAVRYLDGRAGRTSLAVIDSTGALSGTRLREHFETASVVKVMMLVAFLQKRSSEHRGLDASDEALLYPMIHISDNEAASAVYSIVGEPAVARVAREAGMSDYAPGIGWWAYTQTSAADQARFFSALPHLIPPQFYPYARGLLSGIESSQSWGFPPVARPDWQVFFKTGALPSQGLFNEVARLERGPEDLAVAVFTDGDPSMGYGEETIEGVAAALLAHTP